MSLIERKPPGEVIAHIPLDACLRPRPQRPLPQDMATWSRALPVAGRLAELGLSQALREAVPPLWEAWLSRFQQGLRIEREGDVRVVVHCDTVRYRQGPTGEVTAEIPMAGGGYGKLSVEVGTPFPSWTWARLIAVREPEAVVGLRQAIQTRELAGLLGPAESVASVEGAALDWSARVIEGLARRCIDGVAMRRRLVGALDLEPQMVQIARRARPRALRQCDLPSSWWNQCLTHREALLELAQIAPALIPLYGELMHFNHVKPGRLDWTHLKSLIAPAGLKHARWQFLMRDRAAPVWRMRREGLIPSLRYLCEFLVGWAAVHDTLPPGCRLPRALWELLARTSVDRVTGHVLPPVLWPVMPKATAQAIARYRAAAARGEATEFIEKEWGPVVRWAANYAGQNPGTPVKHWSTARRQAACDERRIRARTQGLSWTVQVPRYERDGLYAIALATGSELAEEAIAMRHCADRYAPQCDRGGMVVYSLRDAAADARLASAAIEISPRGAELVELARSLNREPDDRERRFAMRLAEYVAQQVKAAALLPHIGEVTIPPAGSGTLFMERRDSDVYAFIQVTDRGWKGYKYLPCGTVRAISGDEAVRVLDPMSWFALSRQDFVEIVEPFLLLRRQGQDAAGGAGGNCLGQARAG